MGYNGKIKSIPHELLHVLEFCYLYIIPICVRNILILPFDFQNVVLAESLLSGGGDTRSSEVSSHNFIGGVGFQHTSEREQSSNSIRYGGENGYFIDQFTLLQILLLNKICFTSLCRCG